MEKILEIARKLWFGALGAPNKGGSEIEQARKTWSKQKEGICPTLLVFLEIPKPLLTGLLPTAFPRSERMEILKTGREKYISLVAKIRLQQAEKLFVPRASTITLKFRDRFFVFRENSGR